MALPAILAAAFGGMRMVQTCSIYRLTKVTGWTIPIEPLIDLIPGVTPNRVTLDMIDSEDSQLNFSVTQNALQDFSTATSNNHGELETLSVSGIMTSSFQVASPVPIGPATVGAFGLRADMLRLENLRAIAKRREPVMVVTPRKSLAKAFIVSLSDPWTPDLGENTEVSMSFIEARIISPLIGQAVPDSAAQIPGKNAESGGGIEAGAPSNSSAVPSGTTGSAPL